MSYCKRFPSQFKNMQRSTWVNWLVKLLSFTLQCMEILLLSYFEFNEKSHFMQRCYFVKLRHHHVKKMQSKRNSRKANCNYAVLRDFFLLHHVINIKFRLTLVWRLAPQDVRSQAARDDPSSVADADGHDGVRHHPLLQMNLDRSCCVNGLSTRRSRKKL